MKNSSSSAVGSSESAVANGNKASEIAKPPADERPVAEASKGKPALGHVDFVCDAHNRVSLYEHTGIIRWEVKGRGHVACVQSRDQPDAWWIVLRRESQKKNLFESRILPDTIYSHNTHGTTIVWLEPDVGKFELYFHEKAGCTEMWNKIRQIQEEKLPDTVAQLRQTSENNRQLTAELNTLQAKNREILEKNRNLEQELSNAQVKMRDLEAKFDQTDVSQVIAVMKEKVDILENGEILRLQKEVAKLSTENEMKNQENNEIRKKLDESEKRNAELNKEKAEMGEELKSWEHLRQLLGGANQLLGMANEYAKGIRKNKRESGDPQSLQLIMSLFSKWPPAIGNQQSQEEEVTELGPDGDSAKGSRIDKQKNLEEAGAKKTANVALGNKADIV